MANVQLMIRDATEGRLPAICMVCGEEATVTKTKRMSWSPPWVGSLLLLGLLFGALLPIWLIVMLLITKRVKLQAPLCEAHQGHWFNRLMINLGSAVFCAVVAVVGVFVINALSRPGPNDVSVFAFLFPVLMFISWIVVLVIVQNSAIRPKEITDKELVVQGVCQEFVDAVEDEYAERRVRRRRAIAEGDDEDDPKPRKKRPPVDDDDDEAAPPKKKKRPPSDAIEE